MKTTPKPKYKIGDKVFVIDEGETGVISNLHGEKEGWVKDIIVAFGEGEACYSLKEIELVKPTKLPEYTRDIRQDMVKPTKEKDTLTSSERKTLKKLGELLIRASHI